jgi:hypothetical protein
VDTRPKLTVCGAGAAGMVDIFGVMLARDYWAEGLQLDALGLDGLDADGIRRFVPTGSR